MKKILFATAVLAALALTIAPSAIGYYVGDTGVYGSQYVYDYSGMYGPMPYYSATQPVYRITGTLTADSGYVAPAYQYAVAQPYYNSNYGTVSSNPYFSSQKFVDVSPSDANYTAIQWLGLNNIAGGFNGGRYFQPNKNITRSEFVVMVVKGGRQSPSAFTYRNCFNDVTTDWFANEVCFARANGWLPSTFTTNFKPGDSITTSEAHDILVRAYNVDASMPSGTFMTRSQAAAVLYSVLASGRVSVRLGNVGYYNNNTYNPYVAPYVAPTTTSSYYNYNPYYNNYSNPTYCQYNNGATYYDPNNNNGYYPCYNSVYNANYARQTYYNDPWRVGVPAGYYGPWNTYNYAY